MRCTSYCELPSVSARRNTAAWTLLPEHCCPSTAARTLSPEHCCLSTAACRVQADCSWPEAGSFLGVYTGKQLPNPVTTLQTCLPRLSNMVSCRQSTTSSERYGTSSPGLCMVCKLKTFLARHYKPLHLMNRSTLPSCAGQMPPIINVGVMASALFGFLFYNAGE